MTISPLYGDPTASPPAWSEVERRLAEAQLYWLVTVRRDGRPHAVPVCGLWHEHAFVFCTGDGEQKMRNLEANAHVSVTAGPLGAEGWASGKDISVEGTVDPVTDDGQLRALADGWRSKYAGDWVFEVRDGLFHEVTTQGDGRAGGPTEPRNDGARVFRVAPAKVLVFGDEHGQTTFRF